MVKSLADFAETAKTLMEVPVRKILDAALDDVFDPKAYMDDQGLSPEDREVISAKIQEKKRTFMAKNLIYYCMKVCPALPASAQNLGDVILKFKEEIDEELYFEKILNSLNYSEDNNFNYLNTVNTNMINLNKTLGLIAEKLNVEEDLEVLSELKKITRINSKPVANIDDPKSNNLLKVLDDLNYEGELVINGVNYISGKYVLSKSQKTGKKITVYDEDDKSKAKYKIKLSADFKGLPITTTIFVGGNVFGLINKDDTYFAANLARVGWVKLYDGDADTDKKSIFIPYDEDLRIRQAEAGAAKTKASNGDPLRGPATSPQVVPSHGGDMGQVSGDLNKRYKNKKSNGRTSRRTKRITTRKKKRVTNHKKNIRKKHIKKSIRKKYH